MAVRGRARVGRRTKDLAARLHRGEVAVIDHRDLDEVAARSLLDHGVRAVVNADVFVSGRYPAGGAPLLAEAGVPMLEQVGRGALAIPDGARVELDGACLRCGDSLWQGRRLEAPALREAWEHAQAHLRDEVAAFLENTIEHARREKNLVWQPLALPRIRTPLAGRPALVVVRGRHYKEDLLAVRPFVADVRPALIGVDGGADALVAQGWRPDIVVGDMDSVSLGALRAARDVIVHAYTDGRAPGLRRVQEAGRQPLRLPAAGTSEDLALLLAYQAGARPIVAVGAHTSIVDFLEKGRPGMASTFLARLLMGHVLIDAKGVNWLYSGGHRPTHLWEIALAALVPLVLVAAALPVTRLVAHLWWLELRMAMGW